MKISIIFCALLVLGACNTRDTNTAGGTSVETQYITRTDTIYLVRNAAITPANSYSDLFLDSTSLGKFYDADKTGQDLTRDIKSFYNYRNFQYAWFTSQGFTEQAKGFWNLQDKLGSKAPKSLRNKMDTLLNNDSLVISRFDTSVLQTEMALTRAYIEFYAANREKTHFAGIPAENAIPIMKMNTMDLADSLSRQPSDTSMGGGADQYSRLKQKLQYYMQMAKGDSSPAINIKANQFKKGSSSAAVTVLKKKLIRSGDLPAGDTSSMYNDSLAMAVQRYQTKNGMVATGKITDTLIRDMNVPAKQRLQQLIINLYRAQWMPVNRETNYVAVNIPDFLLTVYENNQPVFDIPVAVGKEGTGTTIFTGDMNQVVFSPYWNIPASIVRNEILPKMKANPKYLESRNMERMGGPDSLPVIRQKPGKENALGRVKFLFPNRYDIYLHDTNNKEIFNKSVRAVSHGCIRLQEPEKLANYILRNDKSWTPEKIHAAMEGSKEQYVKVSPAVPVWITYYTAWVDDSGLMHYRDDIYKHDAETGRMIFL